SAGTKFAIATDAGNFWRIIYGNRVGYVYKSGTKNEFSNSDNYIEATSNGPVYDIRSGDYKKVAELEKGQVYRRIGQSGNYHILRLGDFRGFVHTSHTVLGNKSKITNEKENEENINDKIVITKKTPVYDNTSGSFVKFGSLTEGVIFRIVSNGNHYAKIIFGDRIGFVNKKNFNVYGTEYTKYDISLNEAVNIQMTAGPQTDKKYDTYVSKNYIKDGKVTATTLNVRGGPGSSYWIVGQLSKGTSVDIIDEKNGWYQIDFKKRWVNASPEDVRYYLDPNNFINDEKQKFQFLDLARSSDVTASVLNNYLRGKGSLAGQGQAFIDASRVNGVNDIYLVSHAVLETGNGSSTLAQGVEYKGVTVYNMFGIGAYDSCPIECGVKRAYDEGWTTPYKAIVGGAKFIGDGYINNGQNTLYKMRWDPQAMDDNNRFGKQYATDIGWASKQVYTMYNLYQEIGSYNLYLDVPDYK
ncbi:N-acetylglucosaminidase, partial [Virgibacillus chiguensis]